MNHFKILKTNEKNDKKSKFSFNDEDMIYDSYLFNSSETTVKFPLATNLDCEATIVAIGKGGPGYCGRGGGSGYVKSDLITINSFNYEVKVNTFQG